MNQSKKFKQEYARLINQKPFSFTVQYCSTMLEHRKALVQSLQIEALTRGISFEDRLAESDAPYDIVFPWILKNETSKVANPKLKLVEIDKKLIPLIENTDNQIYDRPLFHNSIFIDNDFRHKNMLIKGIYLTQCYVDPNDPENYYLGHSKPNAITIFAVYALEKEQGELYSSFIYNTSVPTTIKYNASTPLTSKEQISIKKVESFIRNIVSNVLDMVENQERELDIRERLTSPSQNEKRLKRNKIALPTTILIKPGESLIAYVNKFNASRSHPSFSHKFMVRGHYRTHRNDRYKDMKDKIIWIKPFIKGQGILVNKKTIIEEKKT